MKRVERAVRNLQFYVVLLALVCALLFMGAYFSIHLLAEAVYPH